MVDKPKDYNDITREELIEELDVDSDTSDTKKELYKQYEQRFEKKRDVKPMVHIDDFIEEMAVRQPITGIQKEGFKAYMQGKHYLPSYDAFMDHFNTYTGK